MDSAGDSTFTDLRERVPLRCPPTAPTGFAKECEVEAVYINLPAPDPSLFTHSLRPPGSSMSEEMELAETPGGIEVVDTSHRGEIGEGPIHVLIHTEGRAYTFGPVNLRTEEEAPLLKALLEDGYNAKRCRDAGWSVGSVNCSLQPPK